MTAMITASVIGVAGAAYAANKSASATNNAVRTQKQLANDQQELAEDRFDWEKSVYENDTKPMQEADAELRRRLIESNLEDAETQRAFAKDQKDFYEKVFKPNEQRVAEEAANFDSAENVARRSGIAAANVNQQFANAQNQLRQQAIAEMLQRRGTSLNEMNALLNGQQVQMPQMPSFNTAGLAQTPNIVGALQSQYDAQLGAYNAQNAGLNNLLGAGAQLGAAYLMGPAGAAGSKGLFGF